MMRRSKIGRHSASSRARRRADGGFTILELLLVLAIAGGLVYVAAMGVRRVRRSDLRSDTNAVAAALRTAYNLAAQSGQHHRVVFDLDEQTFRVETCKGDIKLRKQEREELGLDEGDPILTSPELAELQQAATAAGAVAQAEEELGSRAGAAKCGPAVKKNGKKSKLGEVRKLRTWNEIRVERVHVQHVDAPVEEGVVAVNFFPLGYSEKAVVELTDGDDGKYRVLVYSSGRIEYRDGDWKAADDHMMRNGIGERVEDDR